MLLYILIIILILCLVLWAIHLLPFPPETPAMVKPILMIVTIIIAIIIIADRAGMLRAL